MQRRKKGATPSSPSSVSRVKRASDSKSLHTEVELREDLGALPGTHPHCVLPPHFFERALFLKQRKEGWQNSERTILSVQTWDGRSVMSLLTE